MMNLENKKIYIAGHKGMVGSSILRKFQEEGAGNFILPSFEELDLRRQEEVEKFFENEKPELVILAAAKVGGILANNKLRAEFLYDNLMIQSNIIHAAYKNNVEKLLFLGSSCIYPKLAPQPLKEEYLFSGYLEYTNEPYAVAKIAGIKLCESYYKQYGCNYFSIMPTNLYGYNDNFDLESSHVLPALIRKFHEAKINNASSVELWGTGSPFREFLFVDDLADAVYFLIGKINASDLYENNLSHLNVGTGVDLSIADLALLIQQIIGYHGKVVFDPSKPDGTPRKLLDVSRLHQFGWKHQTSLESGIQKTYNWFVKEGREK